MLSPEINPSELTFTFIFPGLKVVRTATLLAQKLKQEFDQWCIDIDASMSIKNPTFN